MRHERSISIGQSLVASQFGTSKGRLCWPPTFNTRLVCSGPTLGIGHQLPVPWRSYSRAISTPSLAYVRGAGRNRTLIERDGPMTRSLARMRRLGDVDLRSSAAYRHHDLSSGNRTNRRRNAPSSPVCLPRTLSRISCRRVVIAMPTYNCRNNKNNFIKNALDESGNRLYHRRRN